MLACRINNIIVTVLSPVTVPVQLVTTLVGGCLVSLTLGLLLIPITAVWLVFMALLVATSWLWDKVSVLRLPALVALVRIPIAVVGIPLAVIAEIYVTWMPSMGDLEGRFTKLAICWIWPFSIDYLRFSARSQPFETPEDEARYRQLVRAGKIAGVQLPEPEEFTA